MEKKPRKLIDEKSGARTHATLVTRAKSVDSCVWKSFHLKLAPLTTEPSSPQGNIWTDLSFVSGLETCSGKVRALSTNWLPKKIRSAVETLRDKAAILGYAIRLEYFWVCSKTRYLYFIYTKTLLYLYFNISRRVYPLLFKVGKTLTLD